MNTIFNRIITDSQRERLVKSGALFAVTGINKAYDGKLIVNNFYQTREGCVTVLGMECGFDLLVLESIVGEWWLRLNNRIAGDHKSDTAILTKTNNIKYLLRAVSKGRLRDSIESAIRDAESYVSKRLNTMINKYRSKYRPEFGDIHMQKDVASLLLDVYFGKAQATSTPPDIQTRLEELATKNAEAENQMAKYYARAQNTFNKEKWIVFYRQSTTDPNVLIGSVLGDALYNGSIQERDSFSYPIANYTMPLTLYRGFEDIDPAIRDEIMGKLTMLKLFREKNYPEVTAADPDNYVPMVQGWAGNSITTFKELGFVSDTHSTSICMLFDK